MIRLLPFLLCFAAGLAVGVVMTFRRRGASSSPSDWETKYRGIETRYRDLTRRLKNVDEDTSAANRRYRRVLYEAMLLLKEPQRISSRDAAGLHREIEMLLRE